MNKALALHSLLSAHYGTAFCGLSWNGSDFRLLIMSILSAQCTDKRVNEVSVPLFLAYPNAPSLAAARVEDVENIIKSCGLYHSKARNLVACASMIVTKFNGSVPSDMDSLLSLPGVGRKIANLIRGEVFSLGGIVADTHVICIAVRLGFAPSDDPLKVEKALAALVPVEIQSDFCHLAVTFGRDFCTSRTPKCDSCFVRAQGLCDWKNK